MVTGRDLIFFKVRIVLPLVKLLLKLSIVLLALKRPLAYPRILLLIHSFSIFMSVSSR